MPRLAYEEQLVESFVRYLTRETGSIWRTSPTEVENTRSGKRYDCEFTCDRHRPIAADIFRLFPLGSEQRTQGARQKIINKLGDALRAERLGGLHIETPLPEKKHVDPRWHKDVALKFREAMRDPATESITIDGVVAHRYGTPNDPVAFSHNWFSAHQPIEASGMALAEILRKKRNQIDVDGHDRVLIGRITGMP